MKLVYVKDNFYVFVTSKWQKMASQKIKNEKFDQKTFLHVLQFLTSSYFKFISQRVMFNYKTLKNILFNKNVLFTSQE